MRIIHRIKFLNTGAGIIDQKTLDQDQELAQSIEKIDSNCIGQSDFGFHKWYSV